MSILELRRDYQEGREAKKRLPGTAPPCAASCPGLGACDLMYFTGTTDSFGNLSKDSCNSLACNYVNKMEINEIIRSSPELG